MNRGVIWGVAGGVSLAVHSTLFLLLSLSLEPEPVADQPTPTSQLDVQAYQVERIQARPQTPDRQVAPPSPTDALRLDQGAIPVTNSKGERPTAEPLPASQPSGEILPPARPVTSGIPVVAAAATSLQARLPITADLIQQNPAEALIQATSITTNAVFALLPKIAATQEQSPPSTPLSSTLPIAATLPAKAPLRVSIPATASPATELPVAFINLAAVRNVEPAVQPLAAAENRATAATGLPIPEQKASAALAFSSGITGDVDPVSLIAIQSFMRAGDLTASASAASQMRDGISDILSQVPCARLQVNFIAESGILMLNGHVPENGLRAPVLAAIQAQVGDTIVVADNILLLKRPMCAALSGIASAGLPASTEQITNPKVIGDNTQVVVSEFRDGERLTLDFTAPDYDAYIYLDYFDSAGQVIHLSPNRFSELVFYAARDEFSFGQDKCGSPSVKILMGPPYGQELGIAFATSVRLYDEIRPMVEPAQPYVEWLKTRIAAARSKSGDFKGEWFYFIINSRKEKYQPGLNVDLDTPKLC